MIPSRLHASRYCILNFHQISRTCRKPLLGRSCIQHVCQACLLCIHVMMALIPAIAVMVYHKPLACPLLYWPGKTRPSRLPLLDPSQTGYLHSFVLAAWTLSIQCPRLQWQDSWHENTLSVQPEHFLCSVTHVGVTWQSRMGSSTHIQHFAKVCDVVAHVLQECVAVAGLSSSPLQDRDLPHGLFQVAVSPVKLLLRISLTCLLLQIHIVSLELESSMLYCPEAGF